MLPQPLNAFRRQGTLRNLRTPRGLAWIGVPVGTADCANRIVNWDWFKSPRTAATMSDRLKSSPARRTALQPKGAREFTLTEPAVRLGAGVKETQQVDLVYRIADPQPRRGSRV